MISKELLSEVLGYKDQVYYCKNGCDGIEYTFEEEGVYDSINIYELSHKCKEWLRGLGYMVTIYTHLDTVAISLSVNGTQLYCSPSMSVTPEPEAIFKACQWILDNKH